MNQVPVKSALSAARRRLVELLQDVNFGRVERLEVRGGDPVFDPPPRVVREWKLGADNGPRPERAARDFALKAQVVELCGLLDRLGDGVVSVLEIKHGLPFRVEIADAAD
jgi:hypothetical protein